MVKSFVPSEVYSQDFVDGRRGTQGNDPSFKTVPRSHIRKVNLKH